MTESVDFECPRGLKFGYQKIKGFGDIVEKILKPVAGLFKKKNCGGCNKRKQILNKAFPIR